MTVKRGERASLRFLTEGQRNRLFRLTHPRRAEQPLTGVRRLTNLALAFAWFLGFGAAVAEPALNALGITTEDLTNGVFKKKTLIKAVSIGAVLQHALETATPFGLPGNVAEQEA